MSMILGDSDYCWQCLDHEEVIKALKLKIKMLEKENTRLTEMIESKEKQEK